VSNARIAATGFKPEWSLDRGIVELIKGFHDFAEHDLLV
jgi:nucleoside-diphosphate-sugar epimerase